MSESAVNGITREQFNLWKHDPVTKVFLSFLRDKRKFLIDAAAEQWVSGSPTFAEINQTVRGQVVELGEIAEVQFEALEAYYQTQEENGTQSENPEHPPR